MKNPKRPRDVSQLAKMMVDIASGDEITGEYTEKKGRKGGLAGGRARALKLSSEERSASARKAAMKRWHD